MERNNPPFQDAFTLKIAIQDAFTHTKFGIPTLKNVRDVLQTRILKTRSKFNATVT